MITTHTRKRESTSTTGEDYRPLRDHEQKPGGIRGDEDKKGGMGVGHLSLMGKAHGRAVTRWWKGAGPARVKSRSQTNATHQDPHGQQDPLTEHGKTPQEPRQCGRRRPQARRTIRTQEMGKEGHKKPALPTQSKVTLKRPRHQTLRQHHGYWGLDDRKEPSDNPPIKERGAPTTVSM